MNILDFVVPIKETCITLEEMGKDKNWKIEIICTLIIFVGIQLAFFEKHAGFLNMMYTIFLTLTFNSTAFFSRLSKPIIDYTIVFHKNNPLITIAGELFIAFLIAYMINRFCLSFYMFFQATYVKFLIFRKINNMAWFKESNTWLQVGILILFVLFSLLLTYIFWKYLRRLMKLLSWSCIGVIYSSIGSAVLLSIMTDGKYGLSALKIRTESFPVFSTVLIFSILFSLCFQLFKPWLTKKEKISFRSLINGDFIWKV